MLIKLKKEQNLTYMFITHDMGVMRNVSNRVAIMYLGKICEIAPHRDILSKSAAPLYTDAAVLDPGSFGGGRDHQTKGSGVRGEIPSPVNVPTGCSFHTCRPTNASGAQKKTR